MVRSRLTASQEAEYIEADRSCHPTILLCNQATDHTRVLIVFGELRMKAAILPTESLNRFEGSSANGVHKVGNVSEDYIIARQLR